MMATIAFATIDDADARSRELWTAVLGRTKYPQDVTTYAYARRQRTGDPEADAGLPDGVDAAIEIPERDAMLDGLIRADQMTADEIAALVDLYPAWSGDGVQYVAGDLRAHNGTLYKCVQPHRSQSDWTPSATPALWTHAAPAGTILPWQQPLGGHDAYPLDALVTHNGSVWQSTIDANVWEPGTPGTEALWRLVP